MRNSIKIWTLLAFTSIALMVMGHQWADRRGLFWGFLIALGINCFVYFYGQVRLLQLYPRMEVEGQDPWGLLDLVRELAERAKMNPPRVFVVDLPSPTSFSVGRSWRHSSIVLSTALLDEFSRDEVRAVLAYELARLRRHDTLSLGMASALAKVVMAPAELTRRLLEPLSRTPLRYIQIGIQNLCSFVANALVSFAVSRSDYFAADQLASQYIESAEKLATVLWKLDSFAQTKPVGAHSSVAHLFIVNPLTNQGWNRYFQRQPPVERRIEKLVGHFPI